MRKATVWLILIAGAVLGPMSVQARASKSRILAASLTTSRRVSAPPQEAQPKQPQYKHPGEAEAYTAFYNEKDPRKKAGLGEEFLQKFPDTDFKGQVYYALMVSYFQLNDVPKATGAAREVLKVDADNLDALVVLGSIFPFTYKADDPRASQNLSQAETDARHGLEALQKLHKPDNVTEQQFDSYVRPKRAIFNRTVGFVALQKKDYPSTITSLKAAGEDNPNDVLTFYWLGLASYYSTPQNFDSATWYLAHATAVGKSSNNPAVPDIEKFLKRAYVNYHGNEEGLNDIMNRAGASPNPPEGFKVAPMELPKHTGNKIVDAFNDMSFPFRLGGEKAQKAWEALKDQPIELSGFVDSVEKANDANTYLVRIDVLDQSKAAAGVYDIELKDSTQVNVKNLSAGDPISFKGTVTEYTPPPTLVFKLNGEITTPLPDKPPVKEKPKRRTPPPRRRTTHKATP